jgi:hypothetical protein
VVRGITVRYRGRLANPMDFDNGLGLPNGQVTEHNTPSPRAINFYRGRLAQTAGVGCHGCCGCRDCCGSCAVAYSSRYALLFRALCTSALALLFEYAYFGNPALNRASDLLYGVMQPPTLGLSITQFICK